ncbi:MAG: hypothetical protein OWQ59_01125 [Alicyclobacillaceae bacterium]|jgi:hypothetical protein|nr:hypothetical protein [Alicyclobacillaceae bacterium]MCY0896562.1 hypothetical protein [Alicyclobacillaceae bacterium]
MGAFGVYTRWAVVFLIIFVLFFLLCPGDDGIYVGKHASVAHFDATSIHAHGMPMYHMPHMGYSMGYPMGGMHGMHGTYGSSASSIG